MTSTTASNANGWEHPERIIDSFWIEFPAKIPQRGQLFLVKNALFVDPRVIFAETRDIWWVWEPSKLGVYSGRVATKESTASRMLCNKITHWLPVGAAPFDTRNLEQQRNPA